MTVRARHGETPPGRASILQTDQRGYRDTGVTPDHSIHGPEGLVSGVHGDSLVGTDPLDGTVPMAVGENDVWEGLKRGRYGPILHEDGKTRPHSPRDLFGGFRVSL